jgi:hypothetical protein
MNMIVAILLVLFGIAIGHAATVAIYVLIKAAFKKEDDKVTGI